MPIGGLVCCERMPSHRTPGVGQKRRAGNEFPTFSKHAHSVRFVKKNHWGSLTGERFEAPQALTCNTNTGVRIDPHQELKSTETRGSKNHWEGWNPNPQQIGPCTQKPVMGTSCKKVVKLNYFFQLKFFS